MSAGPDILDGYFGIKALAASQTATRHGWDNTPPADVRDNMALLVDAVLMPMRKLGIRYWISSGYRSPQLNRAIGGAAHSLHCEGLAVDIVAHDYTPNALARVLYAQRLPVDRLIVEYDQWLHLQIDLSSAARRLGTRAIRRRDGVMVYTTLDLAELPA